MTKVDGKLRQMRPDIDADTTHVTDSLQTRGVTNGD